MKVPLLDLKAQYTPIRDEISQAVQGVLDSQIFNIGGGPGGGSGSGSGPAPGKISGVICFVGFFKEWFHDR